MKHPYIYPTRKPEPMITRTMWIMLAGIVAAGPFAYCITRIIISAHNSSH